MITQDYYTEDELLQAIAEGNENAFRQLFDAYKVPVFDYLVNITKSKEVSEELLSDIFLKLWLGREWIASVNNMEAFLKKVSCNKAIDYLRYVARSKKMQALIAAEINSFSGRQSPEDILLEKDYRNIIHEAIQQLSPQRKRVYTLSREHGLTHDEIARQLNLSVNTVSNHIKASLHSIKQHLKNNDTTGILILLFLLEQ